MKLIYIAGAYRAPTDEGVEANIAKARDVAIRLWKTREWAVICPHSNSSHMPIDDDIVLLGDLEIVSRCDAIYMMQGWDESEGARNELRLAISLQLEIYDDGLLTEIAGYVKELE